jgi:hypothetical protein
MFISVKKDKLFLIALVFCVIVLGFSIFFRNVFVDGLLIGGDSYYNLRMASAPFASYDSLSFGGRDIVGERAWFFILSFSPLFLSWLLPFLFGVGSFIISYFITSKIKKDMGFIFSLILITSPLFIYLFSTSSKYAAAAFFLLLSFYLFIEKKYHLMTITLILTSLFSVIVGIIAFMFFILYRKNLGKIKYNLLIFFLILLLIIFVYHYVAIVNGFNLFFPVQLSFVNFMTILFTDLGAKFGFGLFVFLLCIFGVFYKYQEDYKYLVVLFCLVLMLFISFYVVPLLFLFNFVVVYFAALGLLYFYNCDWKFDFLKSLMLIVLVCGLLFSFLSYDEKFLLSSPSKEIGKAMKTLTFEGKDIAVVSSVDNGHFITYSGARNLIDDNFFYAPHVEERIKDIDRFYHYVNVEDITNFMKKYNVTYILVDQEMYTKVWDSEESGILYFFKYGERMFFDTYSGINVKLWELLNKDDFFNKIID